MPYTKTFDNELKWLSPKPLTAADLMGIESELIDGWRPIGSTAAALALKLRELGATLSGLDATRAAKAAERLERQSRIR